MISKTGRYWSTGITVVWSERAHTINGVPHGGWGASLDFCDDGFVDSKTENGEISTQGTLRTRYFIQDDNGASGLTTAINSLIEDAGRLDIDFQSWDTEAPMLYYKGDGEDPAFEPPSGWRETLRVEAARIGWRTYETV
ncbi:hypothetical protein [Streptomyces sp. KL116D]|uniref:hypothetical protein n=1 Tax=Streptomyces sp. KL116D TaxID=3045152 RepID=UPI00355673B1